MYSVIQQFSKQGFFLTKSKLHKSTQPIQPSKKKKGGKKQGGNDEDKYTLKLVI